MRIKRVAVVRGGPGAEYDVSMKTGRSVLNALARLKYPTKDITVTRSGEWLYDGRTWSPLQTFEGVDVVFLALHGEFGEDGQIQRLLEQLSLPFTGSRGYPSALALNKYATKQVLASHKIKMPRSRRVLREDLGDSFAYARLLVAELGESLVVKPVGSGSSLGVHIVQSVLELPKILEEVLATHAAVLVEERIFGKEATVGVLAAFRDEPLYSLPTVEIIPPASAPFYDYTVKYDGSTVMRCPGLFSDEQKEELGRLAKLVHEALGLSHYSRSDFIVSEGTPYFLEVNTLPGLTTTSLFPTASQAIGLSYDELIDYLVTTATPH